MTEGRHLIHPRRYHHRTHPVTRHTAPLPQTRCVFKSKYRKKHTANCTCVFFKLPGAGRVGTPWRSHTPRARCGACTRVPPALCVAAVSVLLGSPRSSLAAKHLECAHLTSQALSPVPHSPHLQWRPSSAPSACCSLPTRLLAHATTTRFVSTACSSPLQRNPSAPRAARRRCRGGRPACRH